MAKEMLQEFNGQMLTLGRQLQGLTKSQLAEEIGMSSTLISRVEAGDRRFTEELARAAASALDQPLDFFKWKGEVRASSNVFHRSLRSLGVRKTEQADAVINFFSLQIQRKIAAGLTLEKKRKLLRIDFDGKRDVPEAARQLRAAWQIPPGPIPNLMNIIESAGIVVFESDKLSAKTDALSLWPLGYEESSLPVVVRAIGRPGDRERFSLAHELGHLCLHHVPADFEPEANEFAAEFLMPRDSIYPSLKNLNLQTAAALKSKWKVSMQAILFRAKSLGAIPESRYRRLMIEMGKKGYRKVEPVLIPSERVTLSAALFGATPKPIQQPEVNPQHTLRVYSGE